VIALSLGKRDFMITFSLGGARVDTAGDYFIISGVCLYGNSEAMQNYSADVSAVVEWPADISFSAMSDAVAVAGMSASDARTHLIGGTQDGNC